MKPNIDAKRWSDIRAIFDELVELEGAQRSERLVTIGASALDVSLATVKRELRSPRVWLGTQLWAEPSL